MLLLPCEAGELNAVMRFVYKLMFGLATDALTRAGGLLSDLLSGIEKSVQGNYAGVPHRV